MNDEEIDEMDVQSMIILIDEMKSKISDYYNNQISRSNDELKNLEIEIEDLYIYIGQSLF